MDRITAIECSLRGFVCGLFGLLPFLGLAPAVVALICWRKVSNRCRGQWNPAARYLSVGVGCALFGIAMSLLLALVISIVATFP